MGKSECIRSNECPCAISECVKCVVGWLFVCFDDDDGKKRASEA